MTTFEFALAGLGVTVLALFAYVMAVSRWHERKRHAH